MREETIDNSVSYTEASGLKVLLFFCAFLVAGLGTVIKFDSYFTDFWKIRECRPEGYERNEFMFRCHGIKVDNYESGTVFLGIQKDAIKYAKEADVIIFGNSRTKRSFSTDEIENFFKSRNLTYYVLATEGAGYKSAIMTMENLRLKPKILMVNHEIFLTNKISPAFRDIVDFPDKYKTRFTFFYNAQKIQRWACASNINWLKNFYCNGPSRARWRSVITGSERWNLVAPDPDQVLITPNPDSRIHAAHEQVIRSQELLESRGFEAVCPIWYIVNNPTAGTTSLAIAEEKLKIQTVYADVPDLYTYDNSHLDRPNSEKWAKKFVKKLGPAVDICLAGGGRYTPKVEEVFDINTADIAGVSDFESWSIRDGVTVTDAAAEAPDGTMTADTFFVEKAGVPIQNVYRNTPIKAGTTMTFGGWFWSEDEMDIQLRLIKSCTRDTQMESFATNFTLNEKPQRVSVSYTFKEDHGCALIRIVGLNPEKSFNGWRARADYQLDAPVTKTENPPSQTLDE